MFRQQIRSSILGLFRFVFPSNTRKNKIVNIHIVFHFLKAFAKLRQYFIKFEHKNCNICWTIWFNSFLRWEISWMHFADFLSERFIATFFLHYTYFTFSLSLRLIFNLGSFLPKDAHINLVDLVKSFLTSI